MVEVNGRDLVGKIGDFRGGLAGIREKACNRLTAGRAFYKVIDCTPTRRGPTFVRTKVGKIRLGRCPKTPVAGCAGYGLIYGESRKSIRTAHRYAPKVAAGASALSPHPLSRWRERGPDGRMKSGRQFGAWGMLGLAESQAADPWLWLA